MATDVNDPEIAEKRPELRQKILDSATQMFLAQPFEKVRVDDIVGDAGVAKGLAFYYFKSKRGIYAAVVESLLMQLVERSRPDPSLPPREREIAAVGNFVEWAASIDGIEHILTNWTALDATTSQVFRDTATRLISQTVAAMTDMPGGPGRSDSIPPELLNRTIHGWLAMARIIVADWRSDPDLTPDQMRDLLVATLDGVVDGARRVAGR